MKILGIAVCLIVIHACCADDTLPCKLQCSQTGVTLSITPAGNDYTLKSSDAACNTTLNAQANGPYYLDDKCYPGKTFILEEKKTDPTTKLLKTDVIHTFTVTCLENEGKIEHVDSKGEALSVLQSTFPPATVKGTWYPIATQTVALFLLKTAPSSSKLSSELQNHATEATLGEHLFVTILDSADEATTTIIPRFCTVSTVDKKKIVPLWNITKTPNCIQVSDVVTSKFTQGKTIDNKHFSYLKIQAFKFAEAETSPIFFSCEVRVCLSVTSGSCLSEYDDLTNTCKTGPAPPITGRRRRDVGSGDTAHGRIHHVAATLRVVNDVMAIDSGGSKIIMYTLPCLLMSILAKVIL